MKSLTRAWLIAMKDLKIFSRDRGTVFFFLIFPILFMFLFNYLMSGVGTQDQRLEMHLVTQEPASGLSNHIIDGMVTGDVSQLPAGQPVILKDDDYNADRQAVLDKKLAGFIAFPADFSESVMSGKPTQLEIFADASNTNTRAALSGLANAIASQINADSVIISASVQLLVESGTVPRDQDSINQAVQKILNEISQAGAGGKSYVTFTTDKVGEVVAANPANYVVPGYLVMFVFFAAALTAEAIVRERKNNTMERLLATSVKKEAILGGIFTGAVVRGLIQIIIFWAVGILIFHIDMGLSPAAVIILSLLMVIMSSAFALMLATIARTQRSAASLGVITSLVLAPLGGCWWPSFLYPQWLQTVAKITPHAWATEGFNKLMLFGADFGAAVPEMLALVVFTVIFSVIAILRFRTSAA